MQSHPSTRLADCTKLSKIERNTLNWPFSSKGQGRTLSRRRLCQRLWGMAGPAREAVTPESWGVGEGGWGWEGDRGEGGSGARDGVPTPHNLDLCRSGLREAVVMTWCRGRRCRGRWHWRWWHDIEGGGGVDGGTEGGRKNWAARRCKKLFDQD
jgi:hypothetical protein